MKKIEVDVENATVLLEPGVGFYDLYDYLQTRNIPLWLSVPGNSWGSVIGNALDRGLGYTPYGEHTRNLCGMEVVLPDGDLVRTGMGAMPNSPSWQLHKYGYGPAWDQLFVQSNFGIVTKAGMWLMPQPEIIRGFDVEMDRMEDLGPLIDAIGPLRREGILLQSPTIGNWFRAANILTTRKQWTDKPGSLTDDVISAIRKQFGLGWWGVSLRVYGRETVVQANLRHPGEGTQGHQPDEHEALQLATRRAVRADAGRLDGRADDLPDAERQLVRRPRRPHRLLAGADPIRQARAGAVPAHLRALQGIRHGLPGQLRLRRTAHAQRQRGAAEPG